MDLSTLVKMSNTYGSNPAYVLAGGGNTSVKDDTTLLKVLVHSLLRSKQKNLSKWTEPV